MLKLYIDEEGFVTFPDGSKREGSDASSSSGGTGYSASTARLSVASGAPSQVSSQDPSQESLKTTFMNRSETKPVDTIKQIEIPFGPSVEPQDEKQPAMGHGGEGSSNIKEKH